MGHVMDHATFGIGLGLFIGLPTGAASTHFLTGWSPLLSWPVGGIIGMVMVAVLMYSLLEIVGSHRTTGNGQPTDS